MNIGYQDKNWYTYTVVGKLERTILSFEFPDSKKDLLRAFFIQNIQFLKKNHIDLIVLQAASCPQRMEFEHTCLESMHLREMVENAGYRWLEQPKNLYLSYRSLDGGHLDIESGERFAHWFGKQLAKMLR